MRLSTKTRYGVRAIFDIAFHHHGARNAGAAQAKDIARRERIPLRYLEQIFQDLRRAGLVDSKRGPRGGYTLKRDPAEITLGDVVRALQGPIEEMFVIERDPDDAARASHPVTAQVWKDLADHVIAWFDGVTIADLVKRGEALGLSRAGSEQPMYFI
ncbi:MAG: Rrf2 family transcriptional regulator [Deltaproteobacteria bacterium]|nr:MAG: Rrf2 family transcriptional regulator [Deltaproteobacteria bacterium]